MTLIKIRLLFRDCGDHLARRDASEYVYDPRDLDEHGQPPSWFLRSDLIKKTSDEIEFDHEPSAAELRAAFPDFYKPKKKKK